MRNLSVLIAAAAMVLGSAGIAQADLITNGGFETGNFTGWTVVAGSTNVEGPGYDGFNPHSGNFFAALGNVGGLGTVSQIVADTAGQTLVLNYFLAPDGGTPSYFQVDWNGALVTGSALTNSPRSGYVQYTFDVASTGSDTLTFVERNDPSYWALDDVSLNPLVTTRVPEPFTLSLFGAGLAGAVAMRRRKKA